MKRMLACLITVALVVTLSLPLALAEQAPAIGLPNPVVEATAEEAAKESGTFGATLPEGATDARYSYIKGKDGPVIFQVQFTWEGSECAIRVFKGTQMEDLSGMFFPWETDKKMMIGAYPGRVMYTEGEAGVVMWYDARNEQVFNASMAIGATLDKLMKLAYANAEWEQELMSEPDIIPFGTLVAPYEASDEQALGEALGITFAAPQGATEVKYFKLGEDSPAGLVSYQLDGKNYLLFAAKDTEPYDPSGQMVPWEHFAAAELAEYQAEMMYNESGMGLITWFNKDEGINRSLVLESATPETLLAAAKELVK